MALQTHWTFPVAGRLCPVLSRIYKLCSTDLYGTQFDDGRATELRVGTFDDETLYLAISEVVRKQLRLAERVFTRRTVRARVLSVQRI